MITKVKGLLCEYEEIIPIDLSTTLPLIKSISHQKDLITGSSFPNKVSHRLTTTENEEINRLFQDC
jgi:hypothetical protein